MSGVYLEQRMIQTSTSLTKDLARHLFARGQQGLVAIVSTNPPGLHAALRKQWMVLLRQVQRERASTLQSARILVLSEQIAWMQRLRFSLAAARKQSDVIVLTPDEYLGATLNNTFQSLYLTDETIFTQYELNSFTNKLTEGSTAIVYSLITTN